MLKEGGSHQLKVELFHLEMHSFEFISCPRIGPALKDPRIVPALKDPRIGPALKDPTLTSSSRASRSFSTSSVSIAHILKSGNYDKPNKNPLLAAWDPF